MTHEIMTHIGIAALVSGMQQMIQHYFPWGLVFRRELPRVMAYIIGTLAYMVPLTCLFVYWESHQVAAHYAHLAAVWACVSASGAAVVLARLIDWALDRVLRSYEHEELDDVKAGKE